uniref:Putative peptidase n=1 Tax=viral metagenome TaxID=1070528 RepID=A0A6M3XLY5_9ZZZZ
MMLGNLSTHFSKWEFKCPCKKCIHKKVRVSSLLLFKLEMMILMIDKFANVHKPVIVLSGNRCEEENKKIDGFPDSPHIPKPDGEATDIKVKGMIPIELGLIAEEVGNLRIGIAKWGIHVDVRSPSPSKFWYYDKSKTIYSAKINNDSLIEFYKSVTGLKI